MVERVRYVGLASVFAVVLAGGAAAQTAPAGSKAPLQILSAPDQVRTCLCAEQGLTQEGDALAKQRAAYDQMKQELAALDSKVETQRPQVNVNDPNAVAAFRQLVEKRDATQQSFTGDQTTQLARAVDLYNAGV